ncbi:unnamed protein product [Soboliphyme baturini]|uniref:Retrovirus-related Pol polyprotein from transposon TNT 1-94 n=1 Tax=Soboliphyme baturini TaxID=241478 RepID=A0A183JAV8_9BILA|nr:unnamed protein product [Soboliphyme baturini]
METERKLFKCGVLEAATKFCGFIRVDLLPGGQKRTFWWTREVQLTLSETRTAFKNWLWRKEPSTHMQYVQARKVAAMAVAKASIRKEMPLNN